MSNKPPRKPMFAEVIEQRAKEQPDRVFQYIDDEPFTYRELRRRARLAAHALIDLGVHKGEMVASLTGTCFDVIATMFGTVWMGAIFMPVNNAFKGAYLAHQLRDAKARVVLVDESSLPQLEAVIDELPDLHTVLVRGADDFAPRSVRHVKVLPASVLTTGDPERPLELRPISWEDPSIVFYTSGTTGPSKGVLITQHYLSSMAEAYIKSYAFRPTDVQYSALPLHHMSGTYNASIAVLLNGHTSVLDSAFSVKTCWDRVRRYKADIFFGVGAMVVMLWNLPPDPSDAELPFRTLIGAPIPLDKWRAIEQRYHCEVLAGYGLTETIMVSCMVAGTKNVPGSAGKPIPLYDVRVVDADDDDVEVGSPGEIIVRPKGNHVMFEGYLGRPADTLAQMKNLWFHTGDLGRFDDEGNLWFMDRKKDAIRRRGENISSFEVEASVLRHPAVLECAAFAVPSELGEDEVMIAVVPRDGASIDFADLAEFCQKNMPRFAVPRFIDVVDALPKSATGRLQKHVLRDRGVGPGTWDARSAALV